MPFDREPQRQRSASDAGSAGADPTGPGKRTLVEAIPVAPPNTPVDPAHPNQPTRAVLVPQPGRRRSAPPRLDTVFGQGRPVTALTPSPGSPGASASGPPSPRNVPLPDSPPLSPRNVPLPDSPPPSRRNSEGEHSPIVATHSPIVATQSAGEHSPIVATQSEGEHSPIVATQSEGEHSPIVATHSPIVATQSEGEHSPIVATHSPIVGTHGEGEHSPIVDHGAQGAVIIDHGAHGVHDEHAAVSSQALVPASPAVTAAATPVPAIDPAPAPAISTQTPAALDATPPDATLPPPPAAAAAPRTRSEEAAAHFKAVSYLAGSFGLLVSSIGWILIRRVPRMQPTGQALASIMKNAAGAMDDHVKGNPFKAVGQATSAVGQTVTLGGVVGASPPARAAGAGLNAVGMTLTGVGELRDGNRWKAGSNFIAAALNLAGVVGNSIESTGTLKTAFTVAEAVATFNNSGTPLGGAIDDARKSKKPLAGLTDPKVVGQELAELGLALSGIAGVLNRLAMEDDDPERWLAMIQALGSVGMFLATFGYLVSTWAEWPRRPAPADGAAVELGPTGEPPPPPAGAPPPASGTAPTTAG